MNLADMSIHIINGLETGMKLKYFIRTVVVLLIISNATASFAYRSRKDYFLKPQVGVWFGPIAPLGSTKKDLSLENSLAGGLFFRYNTPFRLFKFGVESSYQYFPSKGVNKLHFVPLFGNVLFLVPFKLPVKIQLKAGFGGGWLKILPDNEQRWDPVFTTGAEMSFPAGRLVNIGLRLDYYYIYEGYLDGSQYGGHIFNAGISVYFNLNFSR